MRFICIVLEQSELENLSEIREDLLSIFRIVFNEKIEEFYEAMKEIFVGATFVVLQ